MSRHITITIQDSGTCIRTRIQTFDNQIHLTHYTYTFQDEKETEAPSYTIEGAQTLAQILNMLAQP